MYSITMITALEAESKKKALTYTAIICGILLLLAIIFKWPTSIPPTPVVQDLIEIDLGSEFAGNETEEGGGGPSKAGAAPQMQKEDAKSADNEDAAQDVEESNDKEAAEIERPVKPDNTKKTNTTPAKTKSAKTTASTQTAKSPALTMPNAKKGSTAGTNDGDDFTGSGSGGNTQGTGAGPGSGPGKGTGSGGQGGASVYRGNRSIKGGYKFTSDLGKATIYALVKVSPEGKGTFVGLDKGSTSSDKKYQSAIKTYLPSMKFNEAGSEDVITVRFNFTVQ